METKKPYQSKVLWVNLIMCLLAFWPDKPAELNESTIVTIISTVNMILRVKTTKGLSLK